RRSRRRQRARRLRPRLQPLVVTFLWSRALSQKEPRVEEQAISPRSISQFIRRRPGIFLVFTLLGCGLGLGYAVFAPPMPSSIALVLLPTSAITASGQPTQDVNTDAEVALSQPVLGPAGKAA